MRIPKPFRHLWRFIPYRHKGGRITCFWPFRSKLVLRPTPEDIVVKLRQVDVPMGKGMPRIDAIRQISVTEKTHYRPRFSYDFHGGKQVPASAKTPSSGRKICYFADIILLLRDRQWRAEIGHLA